jgi:uncharacterized protein YqjF (DUF2071 family)
VLPASSNRPWPAPTTPWLMVQKWHDLLFMHWRVEERQLREKIPAALKIDTFDGSAWVGIVPFRMSGIRVRSLPPIPGASTFPELNLRTYVCARGKPGVWFFSLDAASALAVWGARRLFHLPYFRAQMSVSLREDGFIDYRSSRTHMGAPIADLRTRYNPVGDALAAQPGSLEHFLAERYCLYASHREHIFRSEIDHAPWPLQPAEAYTKVNTMAAASAIFLPNEKPLLHFAKFQDVKIWGLKKII